MEHELQTEILSRVDALAEKLGTTAEYLWTSLNTGVSNSAFAYIIFGASILAFGLLVFAIFFTLGLKLGKREERNLSESGMGFMVFGTVALVISFIICIGIIGSNLEKLMAPQIKSLEILKDLF